MTNSTREEILTVLGELSEVEPALRFGQLVANLSYLAKEWSNSAIWDVEDEAFLSAAKEHLAARRTALESGNIGVNLSAPQFANRVGSETQNRA